MERVLGARVLVKTIVPRTELDDVERRGLLVIPEKQKAEYTPLPTTGIVLDVGPDVTVPLGAGDLVMFPRLSGMDFTIAEQDLRIIHINDIMAVLAEISTSVVEVDRVPEASVKDE